VDRTAPRDLCARLVEQIALHPAPLPPDPRHVLKLPTVVVLSLGQVPTPARHLHLHLWEIRPKLAGRGLWFWRTDDQLAPATGLSERSLSRARAQLRALGLWYATLNRGTKAPTWYAPVWPPPIPPGIEGPLTHLWLDEAEVCAPYAPLDALALLAQRTHPLALPLLADLRSPRTLATLRRSYPWLWLQLRWAAPDLVLSRKPSPRTRQLSFEDSSATLDDVIAPPSRSCSTRDSARPKRVR